jgi:hypothetical protein
MRTIVSEEISTTGKTNVTLGRLREPPEGNASVTMRKRVRTGIERFLCCSRPSKVAHRERPMSPSEGAALVCLPYLAFGEDNGRSDHVAKGMEFRVQQLGMLSHVLCS